MIRLFDILYFCHDISRDFLVSLLRRSLIDDLVAGDERQCINVIPLWSIGLKTTEWWAKEGKLFTPFPPPSNQDKNPSERSEPGFFTIYIISNNVPDIIHNIELCTRQYIQYWIMYQTIYTILNYVSDNLHNIELCTRQYT